MCLCLASWKRNLKIFKTYTNTAYSADTVDSADTTDNVDTADTDDTADSYDSDDTTDSADSDNIQIASLTYKRTASDKICTSELLPKLSYVLNCVFFCV